MATTVRVQAEDFDGDDAINPWDNHAVDLIEACQDTGGGSCLGGPNTTQAWYYTLDLGSDTVSTIRIRYSCADWEADKVPPPTYQFRLGSESGTLLASYQALNTGGRYQPYATSADITLSQALTGTVDLWFCFTVNGAGDRATCLNWWEYDAVSTATNVTAPAATATVDAAAAAVGAALTISGVTHLTG